jgi:mannose-6-phosphate isomerase-like protein (cupin superfamily)
MHKHEAESKATYVLEGELLFTLGERSMKASKGAVLFVPRGIKHGLSNLGPGAAKILVILTPPGFEKFWEEMANLLKVSEGKPDAAYVLSLQEKYHMDAGGQARKV